MNADRAGNAGDRRLDVLMICAHEPTMDPRIRWEAAGAAARFNVSVLGFNREDGSMPAVEHVDGYRIHRLQRTPANAIRYAWRLKDAMSASSLAVLSIPLALLAVPTALVGLVALGCGAAIRFLKARLGVSGTGLFVRLRAPFERIKLWRRFGYVSALMRGQFAPATECFWKHILGMPRKPDTIHCNDLDTLLVGVLAKNLYGCRLVYDAHEYYPHSDPEGGWFDRAVFHHLEKLLARQADAVVTVNHQLAEIMRKAYRLRKVESVPNAEPWAGAGVAPAISALRALAAGRVAFLFQGRFTPGRGIEEVLGAWGRVDVSRAALFLRGPDNDLRRDLIRRAEHLGLLGRSVYFLDAVGEEALISAAAEADVGLIPYKGDVEGYKYSCPNKLSQYLHAGLMVLTNDLPYVREVVEDSGAGLHYSSDRPETLADAANRIAADPEFLRLGREKALRYAREKFNWQVFSETLYRLYAAAPA